MHNWKLGIHSTIKNFAGSFAATGKKLDVFRIFNIAFVSAGVEEHFRTFW